MVSGKDKLGFKIVIKTAQKSLHIVSYKTTKKGILPEQEAVTKMILIMRLCTKCAFITQTYKKLNQQYLKLMNADFNLTTKFTHTKKKKCKNGCYHSSVSIRTSSV